MSETTQAERDAALITEKLREQLAEIEGDLPLLLDPKLCLSSIVATREFARKRGPTLRTIISVEILTDG